MKSKYIYLTLGILVFLLVIVIVTINKNGSVSAKEIFQNENNISYVKEGVVVSENFNPTQANDFKSLCDSIKGNLNIVNNPPRANDSSYGGVHVYGCYRTVNGIGEYYTFQKINGKLELVK